MARTVRIAIDANTASRLDRMMAGWEKKVDQHYRTEGRKQLKLLAKDARRIAQRIIKSGSAEGPALKDSTRKRKGHGTKLVDSGNYGKYIRMRTASSGHARFRQIGVQLEINPSKIDPIVPFIHEMGGPHPTAKKGKVDARPHWRPAFAKLEDSQQYREFLSGRWFLLGLKF